MVRERALHPEPPKKKKPALKLVASQTELPSTRKSSDYLSEIKKELKDIHREEAEKKYKKLLKDKTLSASERKALQREADALHERVSGVTRKDKEATAKKLEELRSKISAKKTTESREEPSEESPMETEATEELPEIDSTPDTQALEDDFFARGEALQNPIPEEGGNFLETKNYLLALDQEGNLPMDPDRKQALLGDAVFIEALGREMNQQYDNLAEAQKGLRAMLEQQKDDLAAKLAQEGITLKPNGEAGFFARRKINKNPDLKMLYTTLLGITDFQDMSIEKLSSKINTAGANMRKGSLTRTTPTMPGNL